MTKPVFYKKPHEESSIKKVYAVMSGKGGVGKSMVSCLLASSVQKLGKNAAILDADLTGPSIPKAFGLEKGLVYKDKIPYARRSKTGVQIVSSNLILPSETDPIIWQGPMVSKGIEQFWSDIVYEDVDVLFIDLPPGTGNVPLTVFQTIPLDGVIVVTSPQSLVSMIVEKAIKMAKIMNISLLGLVENMSFFKAPDTGKIYKVFGESGVEEVCKEYDLPLLAQLPIDPNVASMVDEGRVEDIESPFPAGFIQGLF